MQRPLTGRRVTCKADAARIALASRESSIPEDVDADLHDQ